MRARPAWACLATFASASWAVRSRVTSISGSSVMGSPVTVTSAGTVVRSDHSRATSRSASGSVAASSGRRQRALHGAARFAQALAGQSLGVREMAIVLVGPVVRVAGRLELGDDAGEALGDGVVDLGRHPLALLQHAGLPGLGQQLGVEARVLGQRLLESSDRLATRLVLLGDPLADRSVPALRTTVWTTMITNQNVHAVAVCGSPASSEFTRIEVTAIAATASANGRSAVA